MKLRLPQPLPSITAALVLIFGLAGASWADVRTLRWAHQQALQSLDPMASSDSFTQGVQGWIYEALTGFDQDLKLIPLLAESWDKPEPDKWVFHLRKGVSFHDGSPFTADDIVFSWQRSQTAGSAIQETGASISNIQKIDDYTVELTTPRHNPVLPRVLSRLPIMSKRWSEKKQASQAASPYARLHENGTGPYRVSILQPKAATFERYPAHWSQNMTGNVDKVMFESIADDSARIQAMQAGKADIVMPVPLRSLAQLENNADVQVMTQAEARVLYLGMDRQRNRLPYSSIHDKNPLKDKRVRQAISLAIDTGALNQQVMNGLGKPTGTLVAPQLNGYDASFSAPGTVDLEHARKLLLDAGYLERFSLRLACPNSRYVNDQAVCRAVAGMLDRIGIQVDLARQPMAAAPGTDTPAPGLSLHSLTSAPMDAGAVLQALIVCPDGRRDAGRLNQAAYCNQEIDALALKIASEADQIRRNTMIREAFSMLHNDYSLVPLLQPPLVWAVRTGITVPQRADNVLDIRRVVLP